MRLPEPSPAAPGSGVRCYLFLSVSVRCRPFSPKKQGSYLLPDRRTAGRLLQNLYRLGKRMGAARRNRHFV